MTINNINHDPVKPLKNTVLKEVNYSKYFGSYISESKTDFTNRTA